ncbi:unnamed protein product [marine sediment metagenome]|uniref:Uncharacterized protein n=1 Tax=marine sediment metagenome TaxID=412755 RepID=X0SZT7_9ZZZZ
METIVYALAILALSVTVFLFLVSFWMRVCGKSHSLPHCPYPPMPPVKEPAKEKVVRLTMDGRTIEYESDQREIYDAIAALVEQNTVLLRTDPILHVDGAFGSAKKPESGEVVYCPDDKPNLVDTNLRYIETLMAIAKGESK